MSVNLLTRWKVVPVAPMQIPPTIRLQNAGWPAQMKSLQGQKTANQETGQQPGQDAKHNGFGNLFSQFLNSGVRNENMHLLLSFIRHPAPTNRVILWRGCFF